MAWLNQGPRNGRGYYFCFLPELIIRGLLFTSNPVDMEKSSPRIIGLWLWVGCLLVRTITARCGSARIIRCEAQMERFDSIFAAKSGFIRTDNLSKDILYRIFRVLRWWLLSEWTTPDKCNKGDAHKNSHWSKLQPFPCQSCPQKWRPGWQTNASKKTTHSGQTGGWWDHSPFLGTESSFYRRSKINK